MQIEFPVEFIVPGTPVSLQSKNATSRRVWQDRVLAACRTKVDASCFASASRHTVVIYYFANVGAQGDIDNFVKLIIDALVPNIILEDSQVDSLIARRFIPNTLTSIVNPTETVIEAMATNPPAVYVAIHDDPYRGM